jgi:hypothetical protein
LKTALADVCVISSHTGTGTESIISVEFLNTVRVSCFSLRGGEFGEYHRLIEGLDGVGHGR